MARLRVVIVNYRTADLLVDCLRSLEAEVLAEPDCRVVVVDNGSADGSTEKLQAAIHAGGWQGWTQLIALADNRGFAGGNNAALAPLLAEPQAADYLLLLNPDTVVRPGALRQ